jgi:hypothetical protein
MHKIANFCHGAWSVPEAPHPPFEVDQGVNSCHSRGISHFQFELDDQRVSLTAL